MPCCCASVSSNSTGRERRYDENCHLYANLEVDKEKTRERGIRGSENWKEEAHRREGAVAAQAREWESESKPTGEGGGRGVHVLSHDGVVMYRGSYTPGRRVFF